MLIPIPSPPPTDPPAAQVAPQPATDLSLLPGSDPMLLATYRWTLAHSPSLQQLVRQLAQADRKARFRLSPGLERKYTFWIHTTEDEYEIDVNVPLLGWLRCEDALEPWVASSLFLVLEVIRNERYRERKGSNEISFLEGSIYSSFAFQRQVRRELEAADPVRLKDLPDGAGLYRSRFALSIQGERNRRPLPPGIPAPALPSRGQVPAPATASVTLEDRSISLPSLPKDAAEGRSRYPAVHAQITQALGDLEQSLRALSLKPEAGKGLPLPLTVPRSLAAEASDLALVVEDPEHGRLERAFLDTWKGWQAALAEQSRAEAGLPPIKGAAGSEAFELARVRARQILQEPSRRFGPGYRLDPQLKQADTSRAGREAAEEERKSASYLEAVDEHPLPTPMMSEELKGYLKNEDDVFRAQRRMAVAKQLLPQLADAWTPLVAHLNLATLRVLNWERADPAADPVMDVLRVQAKLALLERFRSALWMGEVVWSHAASAPPPKPLVRFPRATLRPAPATPQAGQAAAPGPGEPR